MSVKLRIMTAALKIRMRRGERLEDILLSWKNLREDEKENIRKAL